MESLEAPWRPEIAFGGQLRLRLYWKALPPTGCGGRQLGIVLWLIGKDSAVSVQTDFPPAEGPANYSANYPAKPPAAKKLPCESGPLGAKL